MFGKVVKKTVADQVIDQIRHLLATGELRPGSQLPPERQLAEQLGMSRPSLREALRALEFAGILEIRVGEGIFVADANNILASNLKMNHIVKQFALSEMIEVRKVIESAALRLAIARGSEDDFEAIRTVVEDSKKVVNNKEKFILADYAFHQAIAEASGNSLLVTMLQTMRQMMGDFNAELLTTVKGRKEVVAHHTVILTSIVTRDTAAGLEGLSLHLENVMESMQAQVAKKKGPHEL